MRNTRKFQRTIEDFTCGQCGVTVQGNGYRNHCTDCFTSRHVDVNPGDRAAECGGLMPVVDITMKHGEPVLIQCCIVCGHIRPNKRQDDDNREKYIALMKKINAQK